MMVKFRHTLLTRFAMLAVLPCTPAVISKRFPHFNAGHGATIAI